MLEFVEGTLPRNLKAAVAEHIGRCPACMAELEAHSSRTRALQKLGRVKAPDQWREISRSIRKAGWLYFLRRYGVPAAAFGASAAIGLVVLNVIFGHAGGKKADYERENVARETAHVAGLTQTPLPGTPELDNPAVASPVSDTGATGGDGPHPQAAPRERSFTDYDSLEADHYGNLVGQILDDTTATLISRQDTLD
jgi:anti-sigma factor RsiW